MPLRARTAVTLLSSREARICTGERARRSATLDKIVLSNTICRYCHASRRFEIFELEKAGYHLRRHDIVVNYDISQFSILAMNSLVPFPNPYKE